MRGKETTLVQKNVFGGNTLSSVFRKRSNITCCSGKGGERESWSKQGGGGRKKSCRAGYSVGRKTHPATCASWEQTSDKRVGGWIKRKNREGASFFTYVHTRQQPVRLLTNVHSAE